MFSGKYKEYESFLTELLKVEEEMDLPFCYHCPGCDHDARKCS